ncbi:MAG: hypothetical protein WA138_01685 [Parvibaculum sp.]
MNSTAYIGSNTLHAIRLQAVGAVAAFAMFFMSVAPLIYNLAPAQVRGLMQITICSGGVAKQITVDENGKPVKEAPASKYSGGTCAHHCSTLACHAVSTVVAFVLLGVLRASPSDTMMHGLNAIFSHARGPPQAD